MPAANHLTTITLRTITRRLLESVQRRGQTYDDPIRSSRRKTTLFARLLSSSDRLRKSAPAARKGAHRWDALEAQHLSRYSIEYVSRTNSELGR